MIPVVNQYDNNEDIWHPYKLSGSTDLGKYSVYEIYMYIYSDVYTYICLLERLRGKAPMNLVCQINIIYFLKIT